MTKQKKKAKNNKETDSAYFLKIVLYFILGTFWVRLLNVTIGPFQDISIPVGLFIGLIFASHEHFQIDRKIELAVLFTATIVSFYLPVGVTI